MCNHSKCHLVFRISPQGPPFNVAHSILFLNGVILISNAWCGTQIGVGSWLHHLLHNRGRGLFFKAHWLSTCRLAPTYRLQRSHSCSWFSTVQPYAGAGGGGGQPKRAILTSTADHHHQVHTVRVPRDATFPEPRPGLG